MPGDDFKRAQMKVGIISCWYKDASLADYTYNLKCAIEKLLKEEVFEFYCSGSIDTCCFRSFRAE